METRKLTYAEYRIVLDKAIKDRYGTCAYDVDIMYKELMKKLETRKYTERISRDQT